MAESVSAGLTVRAQGGDAAWVISLDVPYCGGFTVGAGVYLQLLAPFSWPDSVEVGAVSFADGPADVSLDHGVLRVGPAPGRVRAQFCLADGGTVPLAIRLDPRIGLDVPPEGVPVLQVWTGQAPTPMALAASTGSGAAAESADRPALSPSREVAPGEGLLDGACAGKC